MGLALPLLKPRPHLIFRPRCFSGSWLMRGPRKMAKVEFCLGLQDKDANRLALNQRTASRFSRVKTRKAALRHPLAGPRSRAKGITMLELIIVVAIIALLAALAGPDLRDFIVKNRLKGAAEEAQAMLQFARSEAVKRSQDVYVNFKDDPGWCFGVSTASGCDCFEPDVSDAGSCRISTVTGTDYALKRVTSEDYKDVGLANPTPGTDKQFTFDYQRGLTSDNDTLTFTNDGFEIQVRVSVLGRVWLCSPGDTSKVLGYEDCL
jgi:type IV fimbrial biogenesis protein FimT